ncbi:PilN domain-containing protein [Shewanella waksmanii]|uniref:PilN domain-containing protein n=1 Tax=Shewanella waksmanii TaxID=213783 RepID=UPI0012FBE8D6|nr:hypothetical protein [Shewanella waksmanii]
MNLQIVNKALNRVAYITNHTKSLVYGADKNVSFSEESSVRHWIVVLGRQHYSEVQSSYPIADPVDAIKAAKFEVDETDQIHFYNAYQLDEQSCSVTIWSVNKETVEQLCPKAFYIVPESYLLAEKNSLAVVDLEGQPNVYIAKGAKGPVSYIEDSFIDTAESFCQLAEIALPENIVSIDGRSIAKSLFHGMKRNLSKSLIQFFYFGSGNQQSLNVPYKAIGLTFVAVVALCNAMFSSFLMYQEKSVTTEFEEKRTQVEQVLDSQNELAQQIELNRLLSSQISIDDTPWRAIEVVGSAVNAGMQITNLSYQNGEYRLAGVAEKATTILSLLSSHEAVQAASFAGPVRESRTGERFSINFKTKAF